MVPESRVQTTLSLSKVFPIQCLSRHPQLRETRDGTRHLGRPTGRAGESQGAAARLCHANAPIPFMSRAEGWFSNGSSLWVCWCTVCCVSE